MGGPRYGLDSDGKLNRHIPLSTFLYVVLSHYWHGRYLPGCLAAFCATRPESLKNRQTE